MIRRPPLRYHGSKFRLAPWIISHFPEHRNYCEPYCGGASVLLRKPRSEFEIINDINGDIVNLFEMLRDNGSELRRRIELMPFSRRDFRRSYQPTDDPVERAVRIIYRSHAGFGGKAATLATTGFRMRSFASKSFAITWAGLPAHIQPIIDRLRGVVIENKPAIEVIADQDSPSTMFYIDPPYVASTRRCIEGYVFEMTDRDHEDLAKVLNRVKGAVIVSGYRSALYDKLFKGWARQERQTIGDGAVGNRNRTECLWIK